MGIEVGVDDHDGVEERVLLGPADRLRLVETGHQILRADGADRLHGGRQMSQAVTVVGAEADCEPRHRLRSIVTDTSETATSSGASGLCTVTTTRSTLT